MSIYDEPAPLVDPRLRRAERAVSAVFVGVVVAAFVVASAIVVKFGAEAILGQCAPSWLSGADPQLCLNAEINQPTLIVSGSTSLPDGAVVQVSAEDFGTGYNQHWVTDTANLTVANGSFGGSFDLTGWGAGTVTGTAIFEIGSSQPTDVVDRYGTHGQLLSGPDVQLDRNGGDPQAQMVLVSTDVDLSAG